jgi:hypothetical protein
MPGRKILDEADARACLDAALSSGLPRSEWAWAHGIDARSLNAWRLNLDRKASVPRPLEFVEIVPTSVTSAMREAVSLRVHRDDLVVEVPVGFDEDHLLRVLRVMAAC